MTDNDNRIGIDTHNLSEQEVTRCDSCDLRPECFERDEHINETGFCLRDCKQ